ncbi:MAG: SGNH/GDSL hydrolase family protein [Cyanobacteriota bacterium]|nr:SGNH/GDSL hydrolase family protein [Cyanobacteriota bacterium]
MSGICYSHSVLTVSTLGLCVLGTLGTVPTNAATFDSPFNQIFIFSDSLSDPGNLSAITNGEVPENPLSFEGRFSDGLVWTEYFTSLLGLDPSPVTSPVQSSDGVNYSFGGVTSGDLNVVNILRPDLDVEFPSLTQELNAFIAPLLATNQSANADALYVVWAGSNDAIFGGVTDPSIPVNNVSNAVQSLYDVGARNFLLLNIPNLGDTPFASNLGLEEPFTQFTIAHNLLLSNAVNTLNQSLTDVNIGLVDVDSVFNRVLQNPSEFGFTNVTDSWSDAVALCQEQGCDQIPDPSEYLFWDSVHPTTVTHEIIADVAYSTVQSQFPKVPEPTSILALSVVGIGFLFHQVSSHRR